MKDRFKNFKYKEQLFFFLIFLSGVIGLSYQYLRDTNYQVIRSDGTGYYAYLPSVFIYGDLGMSPTLDAINDTYENQPDNSWHGITPYDTAKDTYLDKYTSGTALFLTPFFLIGHVLTSFSSLETNGFTAIYDISIGFGSITYAVIGLYILSKILKRSFSNKVTYITLIAIFFGTNLYHYTTYDAIFSHAISFFLFTLFIWLTIRWHAKPTFKTSIVTGLVLGLITLVRPTNALIVSFFLFYNIFDKESLKIKVRLFWKNKYKLIIFALFVILGFLPQILYWLIITGSPITHSYRGEAFFFTNPKLFQVLLSPNRSMIVWFPVFLSALVGIYFLRRRFKEFVLPIAISFLLHTYLIASWSSWWYGASFGHRAFVEILAILALPLATLLSLTLRYRPKLTYLFLSLAILLAMLLTFGYWHGYYVMEKTDQYLRRSLGISQKLD